MTGHGTTSPLVAPLTYHAAARNGTVKDFYPRHGFARLSDDGTVAIFRHDLADIIPAPDHIRLTIA